MRNLLLRQWQLFLLLWWKDRVPATRRDASDEKLSLIRAQVWYDLLNRLDAGVDPSHLLLCDVEVECVDGSSHRVSLSDFHSCLIAR